MPRAALALVALAALLFVLPAAGSLLELSRPALASGEVWRLVTGHWVHWSADHLFWDAFTFLVAFAIVHAYDRRRLARCLAAATFTVPAAVLAFAPGIQVYRGLSGLDAALYVLAGLLIVEARTREGARREAAAVGALFAGFVLKVLYESITGGAVFVDGAAAGVVTVPVAHVAGALTGWAVYRAPAG